MDCKSFAARSSEEVSAMHVELGVCTATGAGQPPPIDPMMERRLRHRFDRRIVPLLFGLFLFSFVDRSNIGNARIAGLPEDLGLVGNQYNLAVLLFYIPYIMADVPSNWILSRTKAGVYLPAIVACWGIVCVCTGFTQSLRGLVVCRLLMGLFEGGLAPGLLFYLGYFYRPSEIVFRIGLFYCAAPLSGAFGGLVAAGLTKITVPGYDRWPWVFFTEGAATVTYAFAVFWLLPDSISQSKWLSPEEQEVAIARLRGEVPQGEGKESFWSWVSVAVRSPITYLISWALFLTVVSVYSFALFLPTIVHAMGYSSTTAQLLSVPPNMCGFISTLVVAKASERSGLRGPYAFGGMLLAAIGYAMQLATTTTGVRYGATFLVAVGVYPSVTVMMGWMSANSNPRIVRATATGLMLAIANLGAFPASYSYLAQDSPQYTLGSGLNLGSAILSASLIGITMIYCQWENRAREEGRRNYRLEKSEPALLGSLHPDFRYVF